MQSRPAGGDWGMIVDREKKIAEIREALEVIKRYDLSTLDNIMMPVYNFCVNAPEWLRFLLDELDRRDEENRKLREERDDAREQAQKYYRKFEDEVEETLRLQDELQSAQQEIERLREERDEARRKAEEAWKEIDSLEEQLLSSQQEIERLRQLYEREREIADQALEQVKNLREERNQDRQWIEKASENVTQLKQERDKLIEGLRFYAGMNKLNGVSLVLSDHGSLARDILKEVGVTVE